MRIDHSIFHTFPKNFLQKLKGNHRVTGKKTILLQSPTSVCYDELSIFS